MSNYVLEQTARISCTQPEFRIRPRSHAARLTFRRGSIISRRSMRLAPYVYTCTCIAIIVARIFHGTLIADTILYGKRNVKASILLSRRHSVSMELLLCFEYIFCTNIFSRYFYNIIIPLRGVEKRDSFIEYYKQFEMILFRIK